jgi:hypothetical protein
VEQNLDEMISSWSSSNNKVSFDIGISGSLPIGSQAFYRLVYFTEDEPFNTLSADGNLNLVAVPEPSTYLMTAAGLLGLFLWSADPIPVSIPALMRELGNSPRGVSEGGA